MAEPTRQTSPYDEDTSGQPVTRPDLRAREGISNNAAGAGSGGATSGTGSSQGSASNSTGSGGGGATSGTGGGKSGSYDNPNSPKATDKSSAADNDDQVGKGYTPGNSNSTGRGKSRLRINRRRAAIGIGTAGTVISVVTFFFSIASGPFQFVDFAQLLEKFHFSSNEEFGDNRGSNILIYGLLGSAEQTRLGIVGNRAADIWERRLESTTGLRPVYSSITRRFVGFAIVDDDKAFSTLLDASDRNSRTTAHLQDIMGKGAEIRTAAEASTGGQGIVLGGGEKLASDAKVIDVSGDVSFADRRAFIKTIGTSTSTWNVVSSVASRLEIKRAGVDFHPLKDIKRKATDKLADYISKVRDAKAQEDAAGTEATTLGTDSATENPETTASTDSANAVINEAEQTVGNDAIGQLVDGASKGTAALGILCAAKSIGNDIPKYKYANDALPMIRMGMSAITIGGQIMSGQSVNADEAGALDKSFFNPANNSSWAGAKSVQAELGQPQTGPDLPPAARLKNINGKPQFFSALDSVTLLGTSCNVTSAIGGLPIISTVTDLASGAINDALNGVASAFGTSTDSIIGDALEAVSGKSVDPLASGADYGNEANVGAFLAGNDNAISMGGVPLSPTGVAELKNEQTIADAQDNSAKSFSQRYLDPYNSNSLVASLIERMPTSASQFASLLGNIPSLFSSGFNNVASLLTPLASAATTSQGYDYGVPKFGFTPAEQDDPTFINPYDNAKVIEQPGVLDSLNSKYGQPCFGMTVMADNTGVHVQTESMGSDDLNVFKVLQKPECNPATNSDPMLLRYRFYLADSITAESLDCYEGNDSSSDQSCSDLGFDNPSNTSPNPTTVTASATIDMAHLYDDSTSVACAPNTNDIGVYDGYTGGNKVKIRLCAISNLPSSGEEGNGGFGVTGGGGRCVLNSRVSGAVYAMVQAAQQAGVTLSTSSCYRTMAHQQELWVADGENPVRVAKPGYSNHQMGLAMDFSALPATPSPGSGPVWDWLSKNASNFDYKNYPAEAWHWSPTGD